MDGSVVGNGIAVSFDNTHVYLHNSQPADNASQSGTPICVGMNLIILLFKDMIQVIWAIYVTRTLLSLGR